MNHIIPSISVGVGATLFMDLWNFLLKRIFGIPSLNFCLLGRWVRNMSSGVFRHPNIAIAPEKPFECITGWVTHYAIGLMLGLVFIRMTGDWILQPTILPALMYGVGTVVFPLFVLQPALGFGYASSKTKNPTAARLKSLMTHSVFGVGLYLSACAFGFLVRFAN